MANNTGLVFDPTRGMVPNEGQNNKVQQTVPTLGSDYLSPILNWNPEQFEAAKTFVDVTKNIKDVSKAFNPVYQLRRWDAGYAGLEGEEKEEFDRVAAKQGITDEEEKARFWRDMESYHNPLVGFQNDMSIDDFNSLDVEETDKKFKDRLLSNAAYQKYASDENLARIMTLSSEGKQKLLESEHESAADMRYKSGAIKNKNFDASDRIEGGIEGAKEKAMWGLGTGTSMGAMVSTGLGYTDVGTGTLAGAIIGTVVGAGVGFVTGVFNPQDYMEVVTASRKSKNQAILDSIVAEDNETVKRETEGRENEIFTDAYRKYLKKEDGYSNEDIDNAWQKLAGRYTTTHTDEFGRKQTEEHAGSNYYNRFKNLYEFENFNTADKIKYLARTQAIAEKYGDSKAQEVLEQDMQNYVSDNQAAIWSTRSWTANTLKNVVWGGTANLGMSFTGLGALAAREFYGAEGEANYLRGLDASGSGEHNVLWANPSYWNDVDHFNTFDTDEIIEAKKHGGISIYDNVYETGSENTFASWRTLNDMARMSKFAWSEYVKNTALAGLLGKAVRATGGIELSPGVLAQESTLFSKGLNTLGSAAIVGSSSSGIATAYGINTFTETLEDNYRKLNGIIAKDTETELGEALNDPQTRANFEALVEKENNRRIQEAKKRGEGTTPVLVDKEAAWDAYVQRLKQDIETRQRASKGEEREQAVKEAADAYALDATIEALRMGALNTVFKSYLFDKGTLAAIRRNNPYVNTTYKNGEFAVAANARNRAAAGTILTQIWGGGYDNYMDDVTVGFAKAFGLQSYNNYLLQKYSPAAYGAVLDDFVSPLFAAEMGAVDAMTEKRSLIDGVIGAGGTLLSFSVAAPNRNLEQEAAQRKAMDLMNGITNTDYTPSKMELVSQYFSHPILRAIADANAATRMTRNEVNRVNKAIKEGEYSFTDIVEAATALNQKEMTRIGTSLIEAKDAKDRELFTIASKLNSLKNSGVAANAYIEPGEAEWRRKKQFSYNLGRTLNSILGTRYFSDDANAPYQQALQKLGDAAYINELENYTGAEAITEQDDEKTQKEKRQSHLINEFINSKANVAALANMSEQEKIEYAKERLMQNSRDILTMMHRLEDIQKSFDNSVLQQTHPDVANQLMYQYVLDDRYAQRGQEIEQKINGEGEVQRVENPELSAIAKYGTVAGYEKAVKAQENRVEKAKKEHKNAKENFYNHEDNPYKSEEENQMRRVMLAETLQTAEERMKQAERELAKMKKEKAHMEQAAASETVIKAEDILKLSPKDRARIMDRFYRSDYSVAQQEEIDRAETLLVNKGIPLTEAATMLRDAAILQNRRDENTASIKRIMRNPLAAAYMHKALVENRRRKVIDFFDDKVVMEEFDKIKNKAFLNPQDVSNAVKDKSSAVLLGMREAVAKEMNRRRGENDKTDLELRMLYDGINSVLEERMEKKKDNESLTPFLMSTSKVPHTDTVLEASKDGQTVKEVTTDRPISNDDRMLVSYAADYATENNIPIEELSERLNDDSEMRKFENYVDERNHSYGVNPNTLTKNTVGTLENRTVIPSREYVQDLLKDVVPAYQKHKEKVEASKKAKDTSSAPKSVTSSPVEAVPVVQPKEGTDTSDPLNVHKPKKDQPNTGSENLDIVESIPEINKHLSNDIAITLDTIDNLKTDDGKDISSEAKQAIKNIMKDLLNNTSFEGKTFSDFADALSSKTLFTTPEVQMIAAYLRNYNPAGTGVPATTTLLGTRNLVELFGLPHFRNYIELHQIVPFTKKLGEYLRTKKFKQTPIVHYLYDPKLASDTKTSMGETNYDARRDAPIVMAMVINDNSKVIYKDDAEIEEKIKSGELIRIQSRGNTIIYQPIGILPSGKAVNNGGQKANNAYWASKLRDKIDFSVEKVTPITYSPQEGGGNIFSSIVKTDVNIDSAPSGTKTTEAKDVTVLSEENAMNPIESILEKPASEEEKQAYREAKEKGAKTLRNNDLYKRMKKAFIGALYSETKEMPNGSKRTSLFFKQAKGKNTPNPRVVKTKRISDTYHKDDPTVKIVDILRGVGQGGIFAAKTAEQLLSSNSRFSRLYNKLNGIKQLDNLKKFYNTQGVITDRKGYNALLDEIKKGAYVAINDCFAVEGLSVDIAENSEVEGVNITVNSNDEALHTFTLTGKKMEEQDFAEFMKNLILDPDGNTRSATKTEFGKEDWGRVKWQVDYQEANNSSDAAKDNLGDLYDDGVLYMNMDKLAYEEASVTVHVPSKILRPRNPEAPKPSTTASAVTQEGTNTDVETPQGTVDADTGLATGLQKPAPPHSTLKQKIDSIIETIKSRSKQRILDGNFYNIDGKPHVRVTSAKYAMKNAEERFNDDNAWGKPSTEIGDSFDDFGRDNLNGLFEGTTVKDREKMLDEYSNSTRKNWESVYQQMEAFKARHPELTWIKTGTSTTDRGFIVAKGTLNAVVKTPTGNKVVEIPIAGTVDALAVDENGNWYLYDFKTYRSSLEVEKHGYDKQLSMYAKFLEDEYGIHIEAIRIIPVRVDYPVPEGIDNNGKEINNPEAVYRDSDLGNHQLEYKKPGASDSTYSLFEGANFRMGEEVEVTRLQDEDLTIDFGELTVEEQEALKEYVQDVAEQAEQPVVDLEIEELETAPIEAKPQEYAYSDTVKDELEDDNFGEEYHGEGDFGLPSGEIILGEFNPEVTNQTTEEEINKACGGKK